MDLSPVWQAGPPLVAGLIIVLVGLVLPGVLKKLTVAAGALVALGSLLCGLSFVGLTYALEAWEKYPQETWVGLASLMLLTAISVAAKSNRKHKRDEPDEEDDGGLGVFSPKQPPPAAPAPSPTPAPSGPSLDWADFDSTRESWERTPVGV